MKHISQINSVYTLILRDIRMSAMPSDHHSNQTNQQLCFHVWRDMKAVFKYHEGLLPEAYVDDLLGKVRTHLPP